MTQSQEELHALAQAAALRLEAERALLDTLIATAPIGIAFFDRELRFARINQRLAEINGLPVDAHLGHTVRELLPTLADSVEPLLQQVLASGEPLLDFELIGETPAAPGRERVWRESFYPVRTALEEIIGIGVLVTEITEYRQISAALQAANARTASLQAITAALASALTLDQVATVMVEQTVATLQAQSGMLAIVDTEAYKLEIIHSIGYEPDLLTPWSQISLDAHEPIADAARENMMVLVGSREEAADRYPQLADVRAALTESAWASIPLVAEDNVIGVLAIGFTASQVFAAEDQSLLLTLGQQCAQALERARLYANEQQARLQAEEASRARDELIALISHDLRNPLTAIQGQAQLLQRRLNDNQPSSRERLARGLATIQDIAIQMNAQVEELLDMARLRVGQDLPLALRFTDIVALVEQTVATVQLTTDRHRLLMQAPEPVLLCRCDSVRVRRVLANLLVNAVKYSPAGGNISVLVARSVEETGHWVLLSVQDQGLGIPEVDLARIFEPFHRGANVARMFGGSGLGLASAQQIITQHGGSIKVTSTEGQGSCFCVRLPLEPGRSLLAASSLQSQANTPSGR